VALDVMEVYRCGVSEATVNTYLLGLKLFPPLGKTKPLNFGLGDYRSFIALVIGF